VIETVIGINCRVRKHSKNQHGIRAWLAISKTLKFAKVGSLKFHCFGTAVEWTTDKRAEICFQQVGDCRVILGFS
jgi:hypothetical protein